MSRNEGLIAVKKCPIFAKYSTWFTMALEGKVITHITHISEQNHKT